MRKRAFHYVWAVMLASCGQSSDNSTAGQSAQQPKKKPAYCFFKDEELKGWTVSRDKDGNITLKGKAHVKDPRYIAVLGQPSINGAIAEVAPSIGQNDTGYGAVDDWWDLSTTIPSSAGLNKVIVRCGNKAVATLEVMQKS